MSEQPRTREQHLALIRRNLQLLGEPDAQAVLLAQAEAADDKSLRYMADEALEAEQHLRPLVEQYRQSKASGS